MQVTQLCCRLLASLKPKEKAAVFKQIPNSALFKSVTRSNIKTAGREYVVSLCTLDKLPYTFAVKQVVITQGNKQLNSVINT